MTSATSLKARGGSAHRFSAKLFFFDTIKLIPYIASGSSKSRANKDVT
jgi:hypothetical protein